MKRDRRRKTDNQFDAMIPYECEKQFENNSYHYLPDSDYILHYKYKSSDLF